VKRHLANLKRSAARPSAAVTNLVASAALVISLLGFAGCPGTLSFDPGTGGMAGSGGGNPDGGVETSCANATTVLQACTAACHNAGAKAAYANLDLMSDGVAARLVGVAAATANNGLCGGKGNLLNRATLPATGIFIDKITGQQTCGGSMPFAAALLNATDQACLKAWANGLVASVGP
jgi:hypothetical protein